MGWEDDHLEDEQLLAIAETVSVKAGLLAQCPLHEEVYDSNEHDYEAAYRFANYLVTNNDPLVACFKGNRQKLTDLIQDICDDYGDCCPLCANNAAS